MISNSEAAGTSRAEVSEKLRKRVISLFLDTWDEACVEGLPSDLLSEVCLYLALTDMIEEFGEDDVADIMETLPHRIRRGEFTLALEQH